MNVTRNEQDKTRRSEWCDEANRDLRRVWTADTIWSPLSGGTSPAALHGGSLMEPCRRKALLASGTCRSSSAAKGKYCDHEPPKETRQPLPPLNVTVPTAPVSRPPVDPTIRTSPPSWELSQASHASSYFESGQPIRAHASSACEYVGKVHSTYGTRRLGTCTEYVRYSRYEVYISSHHLISPYLHLSDDARRRSAGLRALVPRGANGQ